jgi:hypothetical protein
MDHKQKELADAFIACARRKGLEVEVILMGHNPLVNRGVYDDYIIKIYQAHDKSRNSAPRFRNLTGYN